MMLSSFVFRLIAWAVAVLAGLSTVLAQPTPPKLNQTAELVLTSDFCAAQLKRGNGWVTVKEAFPIGPALCPALEKELPSLFAQLKRTERVPEAGASAADVILIPKIGDIGATQKSLAFSKRELVVVLEWTATDRAGKVLWVQTIEASGKRNMGNVFTHGKNMRKINEDVIEDAVEKSKAALAAAKQLQTISK